MLPIFLFAAAVYQKPHWAPPLVYTAKGIAGGHTYSITFQQERFKPRGRKLIWVVQDMNRPAKDHLPVHELTKRSDWDGKYSSIYPGFRYGSQVRRFMESDGREYREVAGKPVYDVVKDTMELTTVSATLDGKRVSFPRSVVWDLQDAHLDKRSVERHLSSDGKALTVSMWGSDGDGSYRVEWVLRKNGQVTRRFLDTP